MDLNSLLSQEQLALMQADAATSAVELAGHDRALSALRPLIEAMGFPHRPYRKPCLPRSPQFAGNSMERPSRRSEEHTSELQSLMRISYAVFCLKKKNNKKTPHTPHI